MAKEINDKKWIERENKVIDYILKNPSDAIKMMEKELDRRKNE